MRVLVLFLIVAAAVGCSSPQAATKQDPFLCATCYHRTKKGVFPPPSANVEASRRLARDIRLEERAYSLGGFAELVQDKCGVEVRIDWSALKEAGVTRQTMIPVQAGQAPAHRALSMLLWFSAPDHPTLYPTYMIVDGVVAIGTSHSLVKQLPQVNWPDRDDPALASGKDEAVRLKLQTLVKLERQNMSVEQVITAVRDATGAQIEADWRELEIVGIDRDSLVVVSIRHQTAEMLLQESLDQASSDSFGEDRARYLIHGGKVIVSTERIVYQKQISTRGYDISDLLAHPYGPTLASVYGDDPFALLLLRDYDLSWRARWLDHSHNRIDGMDADELSAMSQYDRDYLQEELRSMIWALGRDDHWLDEEWQVTPMDDVLVVRTIGPVHREIEQLLGRLRDQRRATVLRFMRELEAARLLKQAEAARQAGDKARALGLVDRAHRVDPGNDVAWAMRRMLDGEAAPEAEGGGNR